MHVFDWSVPLRFTVDAALTVGQSDSTGSQVFDVNGGLRASLIVSRVRSARLTGPLQLPLKGVFCLKMPLRFVSPVPLGYNRESLSLSCADHDQELDALRRPATCQILSLPGARSQALLWLRFGPC